MKVGRDLLRVMELTSREAAEHSYCPYSRFPVGAAVLTDSGDVFSGCNVENASLGLSICAERAAIFRAIASGCRKIAAVVVYTPTEKATSPCGACRQVIHEFGPTAEVVSICNSDHRIEASVDRLLPEAFGPCSPL